MIPGSNTFGNLGSCGRGIGPPDAGNSNWQYSSAKSRF